MSERDDDNARLIQSLIKEYCQGDEYAAVKNRSKGNDQARRHNVCHAPFKEFPREEINQFIAYLVGFLTGFFESVSERYDREFFRTVEASFIVFGYKDGRYFDDQYDDEDEFRRTIEELVKSGTPREGQWATHPIALT